MVDVERQRFQYQNFDEFLSPIACLGLLLGVYQKWVGGFRFALRQQDARQPYLDGEGQGSAFFKNGGFLFYPAQRRAEIAVCQPDSDLKIGESRRDVWEWFTMRELAARFVQIFLCPGGGGDEIVVGQVSIDPDGEQIAELFDAHLIEMGGGFIYPMVHFGVFILLDQRLGHPRRMKRPYSFSSPFSPA